MASMWCYWGNFRITKMFPVNPYGLTLGQLYNCLDDFHNCFISDALRAFSKCPFNGISETFDKFLCWDLRSMYFHNCLWLWFLVCCVCSSEFFPSFRGVTEWLVPQLGLWIIFQTVPSLRWGLCVNLKRRWDVKVLELGDDFRNSVRDVSRGWSEKRFKNLLW